MICFDNSVLSRFASPKAFPAVTKYLSDHHADLWVVPATVTYEYYAYFDTDASIREQQRRLDERFDAILPFTDDVAREAAQIENSLDDHNISLDTADLLHAATAREAGATFVTRDADDFDKPPIRQLIPVDGIESE